MSKEGNYFPLMVAKTNWKRFYPVLKHTFETTFWKIRMRNKIYIPPLQAHYITCNLKTCNKYVIQVVLCREWKNKLVGKKYFSNIFSFENYTSVTIYNVLFKFSRWKTFVTWNGRKLFPSRLSTL